MFCYNIFGLLRFRGYSSETHVEEIGATKSTTRQIHLHSAIVDDQDEDFERESSNNNSSRGAYKVQGLNNHRKRPRRATLPEANSHADSTSLDSIPTISESIGSRQHTPTGGLKHRSNGGGGGGVFLPSLELNNNVVRRSSSQLQTIARGTRRGQADRGSRNNSSNNSDNNNNIHSGDDEAERVERLTDHYNNNNNTNKSMKMLLVESFEDEVIKGGELEKVSSTLRNIESIHRRREERRRRQKEEIETLKNQRGRGEFGDNQQLHDMIQAYKATLPSHPSGSYYRESEGAICVAVRKRPLSNREIAMRIVDVVTARVDTVVVHEPKVKVDLSRSIDNIRFRFDFAFDEECDNVTVYRCTTLPLIRSVFDGSMATCFAYGQTGSGKTYTMGGLGQLKGLYTLAAGDICRMLRMDDNASLEARLSYFEIYGSKVLDLLNDKSPLKIMEDNRQRVVVVGLSEVEVSDEDVMLDLIKKGSAVRTSANTKGNENSSRSHAVLQISLFRESSLHGKLSLVDLAGNEKGSDTISSDRQTQLEGAEINKSLLALKECIRALGKSGAHLPFRASKLTQVLKDSFIGERSRTCMIAMISPGQNFCENTLNTLRYADRVKELKHSTGDSNSNNSSLNNNGHTINNKLVQNSQSPPYKASPPPLSPSGSQLLTAFRKRFAPVVDALQKIEGLEAADNASSDEARRAINRLLKVNQTALDLMLDRDEIGSGRAKSSFISSDGARPMLEELKTKTRFVLDTSSHILRQYVTGEPGGGMLRVQGSAAANI